MPIDDRLAPQSGLYLPNRGPFEISQVLSFLTVTPGAPEMARPRDQRPPAYSTRRRNEPSRAGRSMSERTTSLISVTRQSIPDQKQKLKSAGAGEPQWLPGPSAGERCRLLHRELISPFGCTRHQQVEHDVRIGIARTPEPLRKRMVA